MRDVGLAVWSLVRRGEDAHRHRRIGHRARQRLGNRQRQWPAGRRVRRRWAMALRIGARYPARARTIEPRTLDAHLQPPEPPVAPLIRRGEAEDVVGAVLADDARKGLVEVVRIDEREAAGGLGQRAQLLRSRSSPAPPAGCRSCLRIAQTTVGARPAGIDGIDRHVAARGGGHRGMKVVERD